MVSPRRSLAVAVLCAIAALCCALSLCAQDDLALVVPDADARELARLQADADRAKAALANAKERIRQRLHPPDWPCCLVRWSRDYRVMWPEMRPTPRWDLTYRDTPLARPDLITPLYYGTLAK